MREARHPDMLISPDLLAFLDKPDDEIPPSWQQEVQDWRERIRPRKQPRPYADSLPYGGPGEHKRLRRPHLGTRPLTERAFCVQNLLLWPPAELVSVLEALGILPPRPDHCGKQMNVRQNTALCHYLHPACRHPLHPFQGASRLLLHHMQP